jgi:hypothetical protein
MVFEYFVRPVVSRYYHRALDKVTRIYWGCFGCTSPFAPELCEPSDGEAVPSP